MPGPVLILPVVFVHEIGKFNRPSIVFIYFFFFIFSLFFLFFFSFFSLVFKEKLFGCLRLSFMTYEICLLAWVGQLDFLVLKLLRETINFFCFSDSDHYLGLLQSLKCLCAAPLSSDDHHDDHLQKQEDQEDLTIQLTMKITELFLSNKDLEFLLFTS